MLDYRLTIHTHPEDLPFLAATPPSRGATAQRDGYFRELHGTAAGHDLLYGVVKFWPRRGPWMARHPRKLLTRTASANIAEVARRPGCLKG